jgi:hypothetical protein
MTTSDVTEEKDLDNKATVCNLWCSNLLSCSDLVMKQLCLFRDPFSMSCTKGEKALLTVHTHLILEVKYCWARIVLEWVTTQMTSTPDGVKRCTRF